MRTTSRRFPSQYHVLVCLSSEAACGLLHHDGTTDVVDLGQGRHSVVGVSGRGHRSGVEVVAVGGGPRHPRPRGLHHLGRIEARPRRRAASYRPIGPPGHGPPPVAGRQPVAVPVIGVGEGEGVAPSQRPRDHPRGVRLADLLPGQVPRGPGIVVAELPPRPLRPPAFPHLGRGPRPQQPRRGRLVIGVVVRRGAVARLRRGHVVGVDCRPLHRGPRGYPRRPARPVPRHRAHPVVLVRLQQVAVLVVAVVGDGRLRSASRTTVLNSVFT